MAKTATQAALNTHVKVLLEASLTCVLCCLTQVIVGRPCNPLCKKLGYDLVRAAPLADLDWEEVANGLRTDILAAFSPEVVAAALGALPLLPAPRLAALMTNAGAGGEAQRPLPLQCAPCV